MPASLWPLLLALLCVLGAASPARAANPKISLALEEVTCREALDALSKAAGLPFELREPNFQPGARIPEQYARLRQPRNFTWRNVRLAYALRQLCSEYHLRLSRYSNTYSLSPLVGPPTLEAKPKSAVEKNGVRIYPSYVSLSSQRSINLENGQAPEQNSHLTLRLKTHWPDGDPDAVVGFDNVIARDDQGNLLLWTPPFNRSRRTAGGNGFPDEWYESLNLSDPHPRAQKLQWLEADLLVYGLFRPVNVEIPLTEKEPTGVKRVGDVEVAVLEVTRPAMDAAGAPNSRALGPLVKSRVILPQGERTVAPVFGYAPTPVLVGASGKHYASLGGRSSGNSQVGAARYELETRFPPIDEPIVKAVFNLVERAEPRKLFSFRIDNIPLPPEGTFVPRTQPPPARPPGAPEKVERPFYQKGGATLVFRSEIDGKPAAEGVVSIGLAPKEGADWGPLRWQDVPIDKNGLARLSDLAPGVYRVLRLYRAAGAQRLTADGQWQNSEVRVTLTAGQKTTTAPLRWAPAPKPAAGR